MGSEPQQLFGAGLGARLAGGARKLPGFALETMHLDGRRWVVLSRFDTKADAERALVELEAQGEDPHRYRVRKVP